MKLVDVPKSPKWLKRDVYTGVFYVVKFRAGRRRIFDSTGERVSKQRAEAIGERMIAKWLGQEADGSKYRPGFASVRNELFAQMRARLKSGKIRQGTMKNAEILLGDKSALMAEFGALYVDQITEGGAWNGFVAKRQKEFPDKTIYNHWKHMSLVMNLAHKAGYISKPWTAENPDPVKQAGRVLADTERDALLKVAKPNLRDQLIMAMTMGMRLREILKLQWDRVDLEKRTIALRPEDTKTKKGRVMSMPPQVYEMLVRRKGGYYRHRKTSPVYVFPARSKPNQPARQNKTAWRSAKTAAGIVEKLRFHDLRHDFLSRCAKLVRQGHVSVVLICAYAGLSIRVFERVYLHLNHEDTAPVANLVVVNLLE